MGNKRVMLPASEIDLTAVKYIPENIQAPHLTGFWFKFFLNLAEVPGIGSLIVNRLKNDNKFDEKLKYTVIPEYPMFKPEFPPQGLGAKSMVSELGPFPYVDLGNPSSCGSFCGRVSPKSHIFTILATNFRIPTKVNFDQVNSFFLVVGFVAALLVRLCCEPEPAVVSIEEDAKPEDRVELALKCLPEYDPASNWSGDTTTSFRYWKIRDYAYAYRSKFTTPSMVAERFISAIEEFNNKNPTTPLLISFDPDDVRKQAAASTQRFEQGNPLSILDGIFMAIKDDIDCYSHPSKGATTWMHEVREVKKDAVSVSRLRSCGAILVGKANMHELGLGTTGNNANYGTTRNPHDPDRYTGGSSSGPAAIVALGLCSAALGTDGGGSVRIPSSLCGVVGLKSTYGRTDMTGYAAILGSSPADRISLRPSLPCVPNFSSQESLQSVESLRLGKYTEWFNDVFSIDISDKCGNVLSQLSEEHGCRVILLPLLCSSLLYLGLWQIVEIVIPELHEMRIAHVVSIGSEALCALNPDCCDGKGERLTYDTRTNLTLFRSFTAADYVASQRLRRRLMYFHMEIFKRADIIVTPTTGMTAPIIPPSALKVGETNMQVTGNLMRFIITANLLGLPAVTVPVGYDKQGLPIGIQLIGRPWCEASILRLAAAIEETCAEPKKKPLQYYDILKGN